MPYFPLGEWGTLLTNKEFLKVSNLVGGVITGQTIVLGTTSVIHSQNYDGTAGWALFGDGSLSYLRSPDGTAAVPARSYLNDTDTGFYLGATGEEWWSSGGVLSFKLTPLYLQGTASGSGYIKATASTTAITGIGFVDDVNTGLHWVSADHMQGVAGATVFWGIGGGQNFSVYNISSNASHPYLRRSSTTGEVFYDSSSYRIKKNIQPLPEVGDLIDLLDPVSFELRDPTQPGTLFGFIAERNHKTLSGIGTSYDAEGRVVNYEARIVTALLTKEVQSLRRRMAQLEASS